MNCNKSTVVTIEKIINGGYGIAARKSGKRVLIRQSLPGESVLIEITESLDRLDYAAVSKVQNPHPGRIAAPCPYYPICGGCDLQHADYRTQCQLKDQIMADLLARSGAPALSRLAGCLPPIIAAPAPFGYRQRIRLSLDDRGVLGFKKFRSHEIIGICRCLLAPEPVNEVLGLLPANPAFRRLARNLAQLEILLDPRDETICLLLHLRRRPRPADDADAREICSAIKEVSRIFFDSPQSALQGPISAGGAQADNRLQLQLDSSPPLQLSWEAGGFSQVNLGQNRRLVQLVLELSGTAASDRILDLFCGMGNFSLPLARRAGHVHGIESQGSAIRSARHNSGLNAIANATFDKSDVAAACRRLATAGERFTTIVCDPPRQGMAGMAPLLRRLAGRRLIYVSCDPATLCRDLADLIAEGFSLTSVQPIDMFPQTHHIESVALLEIN